MRGRRYIPLWWVPLLVALTPAVGWVPAHRDLMDFFLPMRTATASSLVAGIMPWLNFANGCGEAWFANPETAVLYPPAWVHMVAAPEWALALEIALHLAWLSFGTGLLARHLGAGTLGRTVAEVAAWSAGPIVFTAGVLNNLETLAWVPWMVLAARAVGTRAIPLVALTTGLAWLGGEPQMWAMAVCLTLMVARSRIFAAVGVVLGTLLVAVQMVPFIYWVLEGDRGLEAASWVLRGAVAPTDWAGVLTPGLPVNPDRMIYMESFFFGAPLLVCGLLGAWRRKWLLAVVFALALLATLPEIGGGEVFLTLTGGLVRYPSRFALAGLALLLPVMGTGAERWLEGQGRWLAVAIATLTLLLCIFGWHPLRWWVAGIPAALMLAGSASLSWRGLRTVALIGGLMGTVLSALPLLGLRPIESIARDGRTWPEAGDGGRVYSPAPSADDMQWFATGMEPRRLWPVGYLNLEEELTMARTDSPVANGRLMDHLEAADRGAENRWWLDTLAARWVVLREAAGVPEDMESIRVSGGMRLLHNDRALPLVWLTLEPPCPDNGRLRNGLAHEIALEENGLRVTLDVVRAGYVWVSLAPVRGWHWFLDGRRVELNQGPGIVQYLPVDAGSHVLSGRYCPPGLMTAALASASAACVVMLLLYWNRRRERLTPLT